MDTRGTRGLTFMHIRSYKQAMPEWYGYTGSSWSAYASYADQRITEYSENRQGVNNKNSTELQNGDN